MQKIGEYYSNKSGTRYYKKYEDDSWEDYQEDMKRCGIYYNGKGVKPIKVIHRENHNPLIVIGWEDDGQLGFEKNNYVYANSFDASWIDGLIENLELVKRELEGM